MSKFYAFGGKVLLLWFLSLMFVQISANAQSMTCFGGLQASLDEQCEIVMSPRTMAPGIPITFDTSNYEITVKAESGSDLDGVMADSSGVWISSNVGSLIQFTEPGNFVISVKNLTSGVACWGEFNVEDKLPPRLEGDCMCPDTASVITDECMFTCANLEEFLNDTSFTTGLNPMYMDNCGQSTDVIHEDEVTNDSLCGGYIVTRTWKAKLVTAHGETYKTVGCKQKFKFTPIDSSDIFSPKSKVVVECGIDTDPESLRNYFSDISYFENPSLDSAIFCSYPYYKGYEGPDRYDSTKMTVQVERDSTSREMVLIGGVWTLADVIHHLTVDSSYYYKFKLPRYRPVGQNQSGHEKYCKILATYSDTDKIVPDDNCPNQYKFVRTWKLLNWCTGEAWDETQIIAVMDREAPEFMVADTIPMASTSPWFCDASVQVPRPDSLRDNCSDASSLSWTATIYLSTFNRIVANSSNGHTLNQLKPGSYDLVYAVTDECGNTALDTSYLLVKDGADPIVVTKDKINVTFSSLNNECSAKIYPNSIDVGSYDACDSHLTYEIKRKADTMWQDFVKFTQEDITGIDDSGVTYGEHMIELRVTDRMGNSGIGWSRVRVEDKNSSLHIDCGADTINLDCNKDFLDAILDSLYAPRASMTSCSVTPLELDFVILDSDIHSSCNVGSADVAYFIQGQRDTICVKHFSLGDLDSLRFIYPPQDTIVDCTSTDFGELIVLGDDCNLLAQTVDVQEFATNGTFGICKKIVRTFTTIDWCTYRANQLTDDGIYTFKQVVKVKDSSRPIISCQSDTLSAGVECALAGFVLRASGSDEGCSDELHWTAKIDIDGDDIFDLNLIPSVLDDGSVEVRVDTSVATGSHTILWRATDECGNFDEQICEFLITDDKAPTPQCIGGISSAVMNSSGEVSIWAKDFDLDGKSIDECGGQVIYSFSGTDPNVPSLTFNCDSISNGITLLTELMVWVWDASGNRDFCTVSFRIDDNANVCEDIVEGMALVSGHIKTVQGDDLESAQVTITEDNDQDYGDNTMTDVTGGYMFGSNPKYLNYNLSAAKTDDVANGVSTLDMVMIQQYILSLRNFEDPYQVIAADVTGDQRISALDLVDIRRVILGNSDLFASGQSWIFVDEGQQFASIDNPWPLQEAIDIPDLTQNNRENNFTAIKLGDVNGNAIANSLIAGSRSDNASITMYAQDGELKKTQSAVITLTGDLSQQMYGVQLSLRLSSVDIESVSINGNVLSPSSYSTDGRTLRVSEVFPLGANDFELTMKVRATKDISLSEAITIDQSQMRSEIYTSENLEVYNLSLDFFKSDIVKWGQLKLYQNEPNPFNGVTTIGFSLPQDSEVELSIFDMTGRQLYYEVGSYHAGENKISIDESNINSQGMLYYQISAGDQVATKRMIIMN